MKPPRAILVEWHDAISTSGWEDIGTAEAPHLCRSLGFLVHETETFVVVAATWGQSGNDAPQSNNRISIPRGWIVGIHDVTLPRKAAISGRRRSKNQAE